MLTTTLGILKKQVKQVLEQREAATLTYFRERHCLVQQEDDHLLHNFEPAVSFRIR